MSLTLDRAADAVRRISAEIEDLTAKREVHDAASTEIATRLAHLGADLRLAEHALMAAAKSGKS